VNGSFGSRLRLEAAFVAVLESVYVCYHGKRNFGAPDAVRRRRSCTYFSGTHGPL